MSERALISTGHKLTDLEDIITITIITTTITIINPTIIDITIY